MISPEEKRFNCHKPSQIVKIRPSDGRIVEGMVDGFSHGSNYSDGRKRLIVVSLKDSMGEYYFKGDMRFTTGTPKYHDDLPYSMIVPHTENC